MSTSGSKAALHLINDALAYECKSLNDNIRVMLVVPGSVQSNIAQNAVVDLLDTSLYNSFINVIMRRVNASQAPGSMPNEEFARQVVGKALSSQPPLYMLL